MAKLRSSSCGPLVQGMMLLALLPLASIQAVPDLAGMFEKGFGMFEKGGGVGVGRVEETMPGAARGGPVSFSFPTEPAEAAEKGVNIVLTELAKKDGWKEFSYGAKKGIKFRKYWCKAQDLMDKLGGATDLGPLGALAWQLRTFSYQLTSEGFDICWSSEEVPAAGTRPSTTLVPSNDGRYYVQMTGIRVGQAIFGQTSTGLNRPPPLYLYLSMRSTQPITYIESNLYGSLRAAVIQQMNMLNPGAAPFLSPPPTNLCYDAALRRPRIAIILQTMELGGAPDDTAWYKDSYSSKMCLGILPATTGQPPVLGSTIQSGKRMTIDLTAPGRGLGTLTFTF